MAGAEERETRSSSDRDGRSYRLAVPVPNLKFGHVTSQLCSEGKEMYKKSDARTELLFCSLNLLYFDVPVAVVSKGP